MTRYAEFYRRSLTDRDGFWAEQRTLFLAGEPLDEPTARWISEGLGVPVIDNSWQTESGWPIITIANGIEKKPSKFGSPGVPMYGYNVKLLHESTAVCEGRDPGDLTTIEDPSALQQIRELTAS